VRDVRDRAVTLLVQTVENAVDHFELVEVRYVLPPYRIVRLLDQIDHGRRNPEFEVVDRFL
jgi:hypothetical protein